MPALKDLTNARFGRLTVIRIDAPHRTDGGRRIIQWLCRCECGRTTVVAGNRLRSGETKSCGCLVKEGGAHLRTHGLSKRPVYRVWTAMINRCYRASATAYPYYGGRGIKVCQRWRHSFEAFYADMGERPDGCSIERRDGNGNYSPENCHWATRIEQANNKRSNVRVEINGERLTIMEAARRYKIPHWTLRRRVEAGLSIEAFVNAQRRKH